MSEFLRKGFLGTESAFEEALLECPALAKMRQKVILTVQIVALATVAICMVAFFIKSIVVYALALTGWLMVAGLYKMVYEINQQLGALYAIIRVDLEARAEEGCYEQY